MTESYRHYKNEQPVTKKPARLKGLLWGLFSGTAMVSAFILPVHLFALMEDPILYFRDGLDNPFFTFYLFVVLVCALYHGLYRTKTVLLDLGFGRYEGVIEGGFYLLVIVGVLLAGYVSLGWLI